MPRVHTIYRSSPGENTKNRPAFYSKELALRSFLRGLAGAPAGDRIFVNDGKLPEPRSSLIAASGEVIELPAVGNCRSYRACVGLAEVRDWADDDIVYLVEDDYLHLPGAVASLARAARTMPSAEYFTLYDHPDYYTLTRHRLFMRFRHAKTVVRSDEWRSVRSTCLTFGARVASLRRDSWVHYLCSRGPGPPLDYAMWAILTGSGVSFAVPRMMKPPVKPHSTYLLIAWALPGLRPASRQLYAVRPSLATHLEDGALAPGRDWISIAEELSRAL